MNMLIQMNGLSCLMIYCCVTCVCMYEGGEGMITSCEVVLLIRRGTTWFTAPGQNVTVSCPVKDCGEPLNIIWCKLLDEKICAQINESKNVEIRQNHDGDKLVSYLSFKEISVHDDGLYRCSTMGYGELTTSHAINISVSDTYEGVENNMKPDDDPVESLSADSHDVVLLWLSNLAISLSVALLVATSMLIIVLRIYGRKLLYILVAEAERADSQGSNSALCVDTKQSEISAEE